MSAKRLVRYLPGAGFSLAALLLLAGVYHLATLMLRLTDGHFIYGLDDPYIHLSIARNLVEHGVYGVTPHAVSFASSSVLWPWLLAGLYALTGELNLLPFVINIAAALGCLWVIEMIGREFGLSAVGRFAVMLLFLLPTPLLPLVFMGMENTLHLLCILWLLLRFVRTSAGDGHSARQRLWLAVSAAAAVLLRYETLFVVIPMAGVLLHKKRYADALWLGMAAGLPVAVAGAIMMHFGGAFLSNSLLAKGPSLTADDFLHFHRYLYYRLLWPDALAGNWRPLSLVGLALAGLLFVPPRESSRDARVLVIVLLGAILIHRLAIGFDLYNRYSGYITGSGIVVLAVFLLGALPSAADAFRRKTAGLPAWPLMLLAAIAFIPMLLDGLSLTRGTPVISRNIYEQQYQAGRFFHMYYRGSNVAINDLGLSVYLGRIVPVDLAGLGEKDVALAKRSREFSTAQIRALTKRRNTEIAVLYRDWFVGATALPGEWILVEEWVIRDNIICGSDTLSFFALSPSSADTLRARLRRFRPALPPRVLVLERGAASSAAPEQGVFHGIH